MANKLNQRQLRFCREYLLDLNPLNAAVRAGWGREAALDCATAMLSRPEIKAEIDRLKNRQSIETSPEKLIDELAGIAHLDPAYLFTAQRGPTEVRDLFEIPVWARKAITKLETLPNGTIRVWFADKIKAIQLLGLYYQLFSGGAAPSGESGITASQVERLAGTASARAAVEQLLLAATSGKIVPSGPSSAGQPSEVAASETPPTPQ